MNAVEVLLLLQELEPLHVPGDMAGIRHDLECLHGSDEALLLLLESFLSANGNLAFACLNTSSVNREGAVPLGWK
jgi:hypothetical protein